jgi:protein SCO1/2/putative membrane protein
MPDWVESLPTVNASLNGLAFTLLIIGRVLIHRGHRDAHKKTMLAALATSTLFLASYLLYHVAMQCYTGQSAVKFQGTGPIRTVYFVILVSHVLLAITVPVLAIMTVRRGLKQQWQAHRKIARITFPIWVYVSLTGVIIYVMLFQWNPQ